MQINGVYCCECGQSLGFYTSTAEETASIGNLYCYLCIHNIVDMANILGRDDLYNSQDLYQATGVDREANGKALAWRGRIRQAYEDFWDKRSLAEIAKRIKNPGERMIEIREKDLDDLQLLG